MVTQWERCPHDGDHRAAHEALEWNLRAVEYAKASQHPAARRWLGTLQNNIGWAYFKMKEYEVA